MLINDPSGRRVRETTNATRDRSSSGFVLPISMTPSSDEELTTELKNAKSWLHVRVPFRKAIAFATLVASGSVLACVVFLDVRAHLQMDERRHHARIEVVEVDAPWTPLPLDAKPWKPAPYAPMQSRSE